MGSTRTRAAGAAAAMLLAVGLGACSDDDGDDAAPETGSPAAEGGGGGAADAAAFCGALSEFNGTVMSLEIDDTSAEADVVAAGETLEPLMATIVDNAPEDLAAAAGELNTVVDGLLDGDATGFNSDETINTYSAFVGSAVEGCGFEQVDVSMVDYGFEGVPDDIPAGTTAFNVTNTSDAEQHEMVVFRAADGVDLPISEIIQLSEEESESMVVFGGAAFAPPGGSGSALVELTAGDWAMVCFVPVGSGEEGPPHFTQGMIHEFTVS
jgi:hypothetical protein